MARLENRVKTLEDRVGVDSRPSHWILRGENQTEDEALDAYGRDRIGPTDNITWIILVSPKWDAEGRIVRPGMQNG